jgi:hypothetical protein
MGEKGMLKSKKAISTQSLFKKLPMEFHTFLEHSCSLSFDDKPNYDHFLSLFDDLLSREASQGDMAFDWDVVDKQDDGKLLQHECSPSNNHGKCGKCDNAR